MEQQNTMELLKWSAMALVFIGVIGIGVYCIKCSRKKTTEKFYPCTPENNPEYESWFNDFMENYYWKMLSYHVLALARKSHLPYRMEETLRQKYEIVVLRPAFLIYAEFPKKFGCNATPLKPLIRKWLGDDYSEGIDAVNQVEKIIGQKAEAQAQEIINNLLQEKGENK